VPSDHSRLLLLAQRATGQPGSQLERSLESSRIAVSLDPEMPTSMLATRVLLTTLRRAPGQLVLEREGLPGASVDQLAEAVQAIDPDRPLAIVNHLADTPTARLHVGPMAEHAVRLVPEGYGAHIAGQRTAVIRPGRPGNAVGAVYAAALGAAEAFKQTAQVLPRRRVLHGHLRFCPVTLTPSLAAAPDLPPELELELALIGIGAIGTGIVLLLDAMRATGRLLAVDYQRFQPENRGTYSLGGAAEVQAAPWKTDIANAVLEQRFNITAFRGRAEQLPAAIDTGTDVPWFRTVLTALDTEEARRAAQRLWPDRLIDAGTGDTMLGIHDHEHAAGPCMICFFPPDRPGPSGAHRLADRTGLTVERAQRGDAPLTREDLAGLTAEQRQLLTPHIGQPVCGLAHAIELTELDDAGYRPSIPFVSLQAACLSIGRMISTKLGIAPAGNLVQYDALIGPQTGTIVRKNQRPGCYCQSRADTIERLRGIRTARPS
jgi:hypothetical protein